MVTRVCDSIGGLQEMGTITPASWGRSPSDDRLPRLRWELGRIQEIFKE